MRNEQAERLARALSSPLRMRILRFCLHEARTNLEIAEEFELNPGTSLHHVRTLVDTGFLAAQAERTGNRGAREVPYLATRRSWRTPVSQISPVLVQAFLDEIDGIPADDVDITRLGLKLNAAHETELKQELIAVLERWMTAGPDDDGRPVSIMIAVHPERRRRERG